VTRGEAAGGTPFHAHALTADKVGELGKHRERHEVAAFFSQFRVTES
jgi:hypothetical protein